MPEVLMPSPFHRPPTNQLRGARSPVAMLVAPLHHRHRALIEAVSRWARSAGLRCDQNLLALVLLGRERLETWLPATDTRGHYWTRTQTNHLLMLDIPNVCAEQALPQPPGVAEHVWLLVTHLDDTGLLHFDSDHIDQIRRPLRCFAGLDAFGRRPTTERRHQTSDLHPCRCHWPTRKQLELGLETSPPPMPDSFDWYAPELAAAEKEWFDDAS